MAQVTHQKLGRGPHNPPHRILREHLVAARKRAGLTQQFVADQLGRPQSFVAKSETGERYVDVVEFVAIARIVGLDITSTCDAIAAAIAIE